MIHTFTAEHLDGKTVLVTGGTGTFGKKFVQTVLEKSKAKKVIVFSRDEYKQHNMAREFGADRRLRFFLGDVRSQERLDLALRGVDIVVHAAALKHVPILEYNPFEAIKTNIIGTQNVIEAAIRNEVQKVMFISTDKAAAPANLYGATKMCAEKLMICSNAYGAGKTIFSAVRYGNVFGSRGSFIETLRRQSAEGVVTLTHEDMTRFWMTVGQGVAFVINCLGIMKGGEIFVPKIPSMRVKEMIVMLAPKAQIKVVGIRPGEKLHERLVTEEESRKAYVLGGHYVIAPDFEWWQPAPEHNGNAMQAGTIYSSDTNTHWLTPEDIKNFLAQAE